MHDPKSHHMDAVLRIIRYLKGCPGRGLLYTSNGNLQVECYTDADWAGSVDDRRSTSGYCTFVGGNLVTWRTRSRMWWLGLQLKRSSELWHKGYVKCFG
jgi:hypothetical protein